MNNPSRRRFVKRAALLMAAGATACRRTEPSAAGEEEDQGIIDIHQHVNYSGRSNEAMLAHQEKMGVAYTVLLPAGSEVNRESTHLGSSNGLAARIFGNEAALRLVREHPDKYRTFANEVPDLPDAKQVIEKALKAGAIGIGEQKFAIQCDSKWMELMASIAREFDVPVLIHFQHETYNLGFERFHKILEKYADVRFIGHAQTWWGNIDKANQQEVLYPNGPVEAGGITDRYLTDYPNMFGDLSAGSGLNAMLRDEAHATAFLAKHQDKLLYGTDCNDEAGENPANAVGDEVVCSGMKLQETLRRLMPDGNALNKILFRNARKIMRI